MKTNAPLEDNLALMQVVHVNHFEFEKIRPAREERGFLTCLQSILEI